MKLKNIMVLPSAVLISLALSNVAYATDGLLNTTSTGSSVVSLTINDSVKITGLADITFDAYGADDTGGINKGDAFCVYRNGGDAYSIIASNPNGDAFQLTAGEGSDIVEYTVALHESTDASGVDAATHGQPVLFSSASVKVDCDGSNNTAFDIRIAEQEIRDTTSGTYAGTLQLLLAAE